MLDLSQTRRPGRAGEWTKFKAVTFIVTLASRRSVTLAARAAGMSRKSAYALRGRDPAFAEVWDAAWAAGGSSLQEPALNSIQGDKVCEVDDPPICTRQGDTVPRRLSTKQLYEMLVRLRGESGPAPLAPRQAVP